MSGVHPIPTPPDPEYFDYRADAQAAGIGEHDLAAIVAIFEHEYPHDLMLRELHILRACTAVRRGRVRLADILGKAA
ncbi:MAG: hypothetical protein R3B68_08845 [Phycisphaerales bacterium]